MFITVEEIRVYTLSTILISSCFVFGVNQAEAKITSACTYTHKFVFMILKLGNTWALSTIQVLVKNTKHGIYIYALFRKCGNNLSVATYLFQYMAYFAIELVSIKKSPPRHHQDLFSIPCPVLHFNKRDRKVPGPAVKSVRFAYVYADFQLRRRRKTYC